MSEELKISLDKLVLDELAGKSSAISGYDEILWKIRAGYASVLYGSVAILSALIEKEILEFGNNVLMSATILIVGFSLFGAGMDYSFMSSKLRVVKHRDLLLEMSFDKATSGVWPENSSEVLKSLINSGETKERIDWNMRPGLRRLIFLYGGTCFVCGFAINILAT